MAPRSEEALRCRVCTEVFRDPVLLPCGHSFCGECVDNWWREKEIPDCPVCKTRCSRKRPPCNLALKNLCESFLKEKRQRTSKHLCSRHSEEIKLFCTYTYDPMCLICRDSDGNVNSTVRPLDEAAVECKKKLQESMTRATTWYEKVRGYVKLSAEHIKAQARDTERQIKEQFKKLHQFLEEEEEARMAALREEEEQKSRSIKEELEALDREWEAVKEPFKDTEDEQTPTGTELLNKYKAYYRVQNYYPVMSRGALIDQAKHLGNLTFHIWSKMKDMVSYSPVVLDPNTAHPHLIVSEDLTRVTGVDEQQLPGNPERYDSLGVRGSEPLGPGTHSWDVELGGDGFWSLGAVEFGSKWGHWGGVLDSSQLRDLKKHKRKFERIRVNVDVDGDQVTLTDPYTGDVILDSDRHEVFCGKSAPFFATGPGSSLQIVPWKITVTVEQGNLHVNTQPRNVQPATGSVQPATGGMGDRPGHSLCKGAQALSKKKKKKKNSRR